MIETLITILETIKNKITDESAMGWTGYHSAEILRNELTHDIEELKKGQTDCIEELHTHFLPTSTFQEHSISNNWSDEYLNLSKEFESIYALIKNRRRF